MNALNKQVAGDHYKNQKIQPIQLTYMLGQTPAFCKVAKYTTRVKDNPIQQLHKGFHCIELEEELQQYLSMYCKVEMKVAIDLIHKFTENHLLREVLINLHNGDYLASKCALNKMIDIEKESGVNKGVRKDSDE